MGVLKKLQGALASGKTPDGTSPPVSQASGSRRGSRAEPEPSANLGARRRSSATTIALPGRAQPRPGPRPDAPGDTQAGPSFSDPALSPASAMSAPLVTPPTSPAPAHLSAPAPPALTHTSSAPPAPTSWAEMAAGASSYIYRRPVEHPDASWVEVRRMEQAALESEEKGVPLLAYEPRLQKYAKVPGRIYSLEEPTEDTLI